jgi:hypothetical protein
MQYVYLNNVRGFTRALVPIRSCNFLVGENSTGKSSFLSLFRLLSRPELFVSTGISIADDDSPSAFSDLVSAWSPDKTFFDLGLLDISLPTDGKPRVQFWLYRFVELEASPVVHLFVQRRLNTETHLRFTKRSTEFQKVDLTTSPANEQNAVAAFLAAADALGNQEGSFEKLPKYFSGYPPIGLALSVVSSVLSKKETSKREFHLEMPTPRELTWIAPIRTRPQRIYDGLSRDYSAEGTHTPFVLKQHLKSKQFIAKLKEFGETSGLFEVVGTHTFGKGARNPFEVLIQIKGEQFNIENVGYGVSQVMPLVVEFLARKEGRRFAVQQPEVHLHPRAQAALGSLLFYLCTERRQSFIVETHSDFMIDRYRLEMNGADKSPDSQILFFDRSETGNRISSIPIDGRGRYPADQPSAFRDFFVREEMRMLSL